MRKSLERAKELRNHAEDYLLFKENIKKIESIRQTSYLKTKAKLLKYFNASEQDWNDWKWQMRHRLDNDVILDELLPLNPKEKNAITEIIKTNRFAIVPYYFALITDHKDDPIKKLSIPSVNELCLDGEIDPMDEEHTNPIGSITRRYPDRLIINVTNVCAMYCRHCQRRRLIGENDTHTSLNDIKESINYIRENKEIRDVLLTGGDCLLLSNHQLEEILKELRSIPHVEIIRIGSRTPVTMPMRITIPLVDMIRKYHPIYLNTHFNHPFEMTPESKKACEILVNNGIVLGNQAVLLKGINDNPYTMAYLNHKLLQARVRPYYIFHAKNVQGTTHFIPKLEDGLNIMEYLRGNTSGLAIPTYIMNAPMGLGKVPLLPKYIMKKENSKYTIRTWENKEFIYQDIE